MTIQNDMRTPLKKVRGLGAARDGTEHFWHQRLTAALNIPLTFILFGVVAATFGLGFEETRALFANPIIGLLLAAAIINIAWHMKLGMQMVIEDYVHSDGMKALLLLANNAYCAAVALIALYALIKLALLG
ncbi:succinate dehydrogenase, hydrophobic membrane anchor protein [Notoacmeibacter sp. MSK16QG-6]|uniref:succinate dehydrogenase, hydrophobic membrane anchor protein n=1 Tax=Notoacmeibacter sp. MSK16QG-6 TaxID=2957982 RepID=UPI00209F4914|nr:succinate dehydrogenase, hydrophobic membrane anchor protein [Notoacmeibacter sp. MSK16QG-6]MCP1199201.1 succinate dehydrogenase, hydrophobic membrane anchor protein [Notoacmeibacter sp. MSK16QG-6]